MVSLMRALASCSAFFLGNFGKILGTANVEVVSKSRLIVVKLVAPNQARYESTLKVHWQLVLEYIIPRRGPASRLFQ